MGREIKRVALDFKWPEGKVWHGYVPPDGVDTNGWGDKEWDEFFETGKYDPPGGDGWQIWENVSEGSPISPVFPTSEALVEYLVSAGTSREAADSFVRMKWAPSMVFHGGKCYMGVDACEVLERDARK